MSEHLFERSGILDMHDGHVLVENSRYAVFMGLAIDVILFAGLIGAYLVLRASAHEWPPPELASLGSGFALASAVSLLVGTCALLYSIRSQTQNRLGQMRFGLLVTVAALMIFFGLNGSDWITVAQHERLAHSLFGGIYFMVTGIFHLHVVAAMLYTLAKLRQTLRWKRYTRSTLSVQHLMYFFTLLAGVWIAIFFVVYP